MKGLTLCGGLGDAIIVLHESTGYEDLERLGPDDRARVYVISHNPYVAELFRWHPRAAQIEVCVARHFFLNFFDADERRRAGLPPEPIDPNPGRTRAPVRFWPSPDDERILSELPVEPFVAVAPSASGMEIENRNLPDALLIQSLAIARTMRIPAVILGRTYQGPHAQKKPPVRPSGAGILDLTDRLSVPGTFEVVKRAGAVLSAHSCLTILSWFERKPLFLAYPPQYKFHDFDHPSPFGFGKDYPETTRMLFSEFRPSKFATFLSKHIPGRLP
jgi:hypothetical protein